MSNKQVQLSRNSVRGYVTHQEFGGLHIPATVQNLVLRDYTKKIGLTFELSVGEYFFPNCYVQLDGLLQSLPQLAGVVMCSLFMLPKNLRARLAIYEKFLEANASLHLVFETHVIRTSADIERAEDILKYNETLMRCPKSIPMELLPSLGGADFFA